MCIYIYIHQYIYTILINYYIYDMVSLRIQEWPINLPNQDFSRISKIENPWKSNIPPEFISLRNLNNWTTQTPSHQLNVATLDLDSSPIKATLAWFWFHFNAWILMNMGPNPWGHRAVEWTGAHMGWDMPMGLTPRDWMTGRDMLGPYSKQESKRGKLRHLPPLLVT